MESEGGGHGPEAWKRFQIRQTLVRAEVLPQAIVPDTRGFGEKYNTVVNTAAKFSIFPMRSMEKSPAREHGETIRRFLGVSPEVILRGWCLPQGSQRIFQLCFAVVC